MLLFLTACSDCEYRIIRTFCFGELIGVLVGLGPRANRTRSFANSKHMYIVHSHLSTI